MKSISFFALISISCIAACAGALLFIAQHPWVDLTVLTHYNPGSPSIVFDCHGNELMRFQYDRRKPIQLQAVPPAIIHAFLSAEDRDFFSHSGISFKGIIRSFLTNIWRGRIVQGASTITQQLIKLLYFNSERTFKRKVKEQLLAFIVEHQCTKEQILETYLNHIYLGCGIYGVEAATQRFWKKSVYEVTTDEAALIAGIARSPGRYCPLINPEAALLRRNRVLRSMFDAGYLSQDELTILQAKPLHIEQEQSPLCDMPHLKEMLRTFLEEKVGKHLLYTGGLTIATTVDAHIQKNAEVLFKRHITHHRAQGLSRVDGGLICLESSSGSIRALIGGYNFKDSQFNRATQAMRQIGSIFKPIIYATALEQGYTLADTDIDEPATYMFHNTLWEPNNYDKKFEGEITLAHALIRSNNMVTIKLLQRIGITHTIERAKMYGLTVPLPPYPSLALGCVDSTLLETASMMNVFATHGYYIQPYLVQWIKDNRGKKIWKHTPVSHSVTTSCIADQICYALMQAMERRKQLLQLKWPHCDCMGKTGTTNDARSCWFIGATPTYTTAIYMGYDDNRPLNSFASRTAIPLWVDFNTAIEQPERHFSYNPRLQEIIIDRFSGENVSKSPHHQHALRILHTPQ